MESIKSAALVLTLLLWSCSAVASQAHELHVSRKLLDSAPQCARAGQFVADASTACKMFWQCTGSGQGSYQSCGSGTAFDSGCSCCNFPSAFTCSAAPSSPASAASPPPATPSSATPAASPPPPRAASPGSSAPPPTSPTSSSPSAGSGVASYVTADLFQQIFKHTNDAACKHPNFYTYQSFTSAADAFPGFGTSKDAAINKREVAAFLAQISHETTGGPASNDDHSWGLCIDEEQTSSAYCDQSSGQCAPGVSYHGRGPIQLSWNYNYGPAGLALGFDGINNPGAVLKDATLAWKTAIRFWMTAAGSKPSCHDVMNGNWKPSSADTAAGRSSGFGTVTNIVNGGIECGPGRMNSQGGPDRIAFFQRFVSLLGTDAGSNLSCDNQQHF